jgi:hypothetical protein
MARLLIVGLQRVSSAWSIFNAAELSPTDVWKIVRNMFGTPASLTTKPVPLLVRAARKDLFKKWITP